MTIFHQNISGNGKVLKNSSTTVTTNIAEFLYLNYKINIYMVESSALLLYSSWAIVTIRDSLFIFHFTLMQILYKMTDCVFLLGVL